MHACLDVHPRLQVDNWVKLVTDQLLQPFRIYQVMIYILWTWYSYFFIAFLFFLVVTGAAVYDILRMRADRSNIVKMTEYFTYVEVLRDGEEWVEVDSRRLVRVCVCCMLMVHVRMVDAY